MYKIAFFCIPAHGHTNPTLEVVRELVSRGHRVRFYSFAGFRDKIEAAGAEFVGCDECDLQTKPSAEDAARVGKDIAFSIGLLVNSTIAMDEMVCRSLSEFAPDCVVADSMAAWGRFAAQKLGLPFISSTTTFAFNRYSSKIMKQDLGQLFALLRAIPSVNRDIKRMQAHGYPVRNMLSLIQNSNDTSTIVYTSPEFQPCADTFSDNYAFVGPSIKEVPPMARSSDRPSVYISLGTVNNKMPDFYGNCILAFADGKYDIVMSVGESTDIGALGDIPANITVKSRVNQVEVLQSTDVFLSHCGMNSASESLYYRVPLVLYPQTVEQGGVARRISDLQAGVYLQQNSAQAIRQAVEAVLSQPLYKENAAKIADSFRRAGGAPAAADMIIKVIAAHRA